MEYGDYQCPYARLAFREIELVRTRSSGDVRFGFRHFPLTGILPASVRSISTELVVG
jgi:protein-disulfide isomerase